MTSAVDERGTEASRKFRVLLTAAALVSYPGLAGGCSSKIVLENRWSACRPRHVASTAPKTLFSSNASMRQGSKMASAACSRH
jgi:hypothetical protein